MTRLGFWIMVDKVIIKSVLQWLLYLFSGSIAILFIIKGGAINQYRTYATNFKKKEIPVSQRPVVTICPEGRRKYNYGVDFNISIGSIVAKLGNNSVKCSDFPNTEDGSDYYTYNDCDYDVSETNFFLESVYNYFKRMPCYKVVYDPNHFYDVDIPFQIVSVFGDSIPFEELPEIIRVYLTSNENSHGVIYRTWIDGNELSLKFRKVSAAVGV